MKNMIFILISIITIIQISAQEVSQNILVEHYTNTRCGICANKNPALFTLLDDYDEIHIAYYPSNPYSTCIFSQHNSSEADGRTSYYGILNGTPRVVLNGEVVGPSTTILQESRIDAEVPNMTPFTIDVTQEYINSNSVKVSVTVNTVATTSLINLTLQVMLAEELINYDAPNGESTHPNVFRKALYGLNGESFTAPNNGSSETFEINYSFDPDWNVEDLKIVAFVQDDSDKSVKQSEASPRLGEYISPTSINSLNETNIEIYPNPVQDFLNIKGAISDITKLKIYNLIGNVVIETPQKETINIESLENGIYFIEIFKNNQKFIQKFYKK